MSVNSDRLSLECCLISVECTPHSSSLGTHQRVCMTAPIGGWMSPESEIIQIHTCFNRDDNTDTAKCM